MSDLKNETILYYAPYASGHNTEYINHLIDYMNKVGCPYRKVYFFFAKAAKSQINSVDFPSSKVEIIWSDTSEPDWESLIHRIPFDRICFFILDHFLKNRKALNILRKHHKKIYGIYFRPFTRFYNPNGVQFFSAFYQFIREGFTFLYNSPLVTQILVLSDSEFKKKMAFLVPSGKIRDIQDPPQSIIRKSPLNIYESHHLPENSRILLAFGSHAKRKGTLNVLKALEQLELDASQHVSYFIIGKFHSKDYYQACKNIADSINLQPTKTVFMNNEFVSLEEKEAYFFHCDAVIMPYIGFYFSSGIYLHAHQYHKPILASNIGIVGQNIRKYKTGLVVNPYSIEALVKGISDLIQMDAVPPENFERYFEENKASPSSFAKVLLLD